MKDVRLGELYVSPHLDDAVLSAGGAINRAGRTGAGEVVVATVFAAPLQLGSQLPQARRFHSIMGLSEGTDPQLRRREDLAAVAVLGARAVHLTFDDCIYRVRSDGKPLVALDEDVFLAPEEAAGEPELVHEVTASLTELCRELEPGRLHLPLGLGSHRDHCLVRLAGEVAWAGLADPPELWFYEDAPYVFRLAEDDLVRERRSPPARSKRQLIALAEEDLGAKLSAVGRYESQRPVAWEGPSSLEEAITAHARLTGGGPPAERQWLSGRCGGS